jgi:hypothetical protein
VTLEAGELGGRFAVVRAGVLGNGDLGAVVADAVGHTAEEGEGGRVAGVKRLGAFPGIAGGEARAEWGEVRTKKAAWRRWPATTTVAWP